MCSVTEIKEERIAQLNKEIAALEVRFAERQKEVSQYFQATNALSALKADYEQRLEKMREQIRLSEKQKRRLKNLAQLCEAWLKSRNTD